MDLKTYSTNGSHGVVNSAGAQTTLNYLKATAFSEDHVALVHTDVVEAEVTVAVRSIVKAND